MDAVRELQTVNDDGGKLACANPKSTPNTCGDGPEALTLCPAYHSRNSRERISDFEGQTNKTYSVLTSHVRNLTLSIRAEPF